MTLIGKDIFCYTQEGVTDNMATIKEIANRAGVSIGTVDRVLHKRGRVSKKTEELILQIAKELDYKPNSIGQGLAILKKKLRLSFFCFDPVRYPFYEDVLNGAKKKAEELSQYGVEVTVHIYSVENPIIDFSTLQTDGIVVPGVADIPVIHQLMDWAQDREIPVVCYNTPLNDRGYLAYVGCDYVQSGKIAAGLCAMVSNEVGKVCILTEDDGRAPSFQRRVLGFRRELEEHYPAMEIVGIYCTQGSMEETVYQMLWEQPEIDTVYLINPGDYRACQIIRSTAKNPNIRIITNDLTAQQRKMVKDGVISATICQEPERQGSQPLELLFQYLAHQSVPYEKNIYTTLSIHIGQNV